MEKGAKSTRAYVEIQKNQKGHKGAQSREPCLYPLRETLLRSEGRVRTSGGKVPAGPQRKIGKPSEQHHQGKKGWKTPPHTRRRGKGIPWVRGGSLVLSNKVLNHRKKATVKADKRANAAQGRVPRRLKTVTKSGEN